MATVNEPEAPQEREEETPQLSAHEAVDYLLGREPDETELAEREQARAEEDLRSGKTAERAVAAARSYSEEVETLRGQFPSIVTDEAIAALDPPLRLIAEQHGEEVASNPIVIAQTYRALGGEETFAATAPERAIDGIIERDQRARSF